MKNEANPLERRGTIFISFLLGLATLLVYGQACSFDFVNYDDMALICRNPVVTGGVRAGGLIWAATTSYYEYWHPVTWLSHMLDCTLFGLRPGFHHLISVLIHLANTLLLFRLLRLMTGAFGRSAF